MLWGPDYEAFRRRLVQARKLAKMTQRDAATALGRSPSYVAKSENGERRVDIVELLHFARIYRRSLQYFAGSGRPKD
jgi:transcriptional regulator with XRE-family HTH domain